MIRHTLIVLSVLKLVCWQENVLASEGRGPTAAAIGVPAAPVDPSGWLKPVTSKFYLAKARDLAKAWHADAELYSVSSAYALADGTATPKTESSGYQTAWEYAFYSKQANKAFKVDVTEKGLQTAEAYLPFPAAMVKFLSDDFADSDRVLQAGKTAGWKLGSQPISMSLSWMVSDKSAHWDIQAADTHHFVDASSGKVIG